MLSVRPFIAVMIWFAVTFFAFSLSVSAEDLDFQSQKPITENEFRSQYKKAILKYKNGYQNFEGRVRCQYQLDDPGDLSRKKKYDYSGHLMMKGNSAVCVKAYDVDTPLAGMYSNEVACITPRYGFELYKKQRDKPYLLSSIIYASDRVKRMRLIMGNDVDLFLCAASSMYHNPFDTILEKPTFTFVKLERLPARSDQEGESVALDFELTNDPWDISSGHIVFAPALNWAVLEYHYRCDYSPTNYSIHAGKHTYSTDQKYAVPFPEKIEYELKHYHDDKPPILETNLVDLSDIKMGTVKDSAFLLSEYGLSDAPLTPPAASQTSTLQWFLIINGILFLLIIAWIVINRFRTASNRKSDE